MNTPTKTRKQTANIAPFGIRMQPDLKEQLEIAARESGRSLNSELIARLEASFGAETNERQLDSMFSALKQSYSDKERMLAEKNKSARMIIGILAQKFESAVDALEGNKKLTKTEIRNLKLDLWNLEEYRKILEHSKSSEHIADDDEDGDGNESGDDDFGQEEPGLTIRNKP